MLKNLKQILFIGKCDINSGGGRDEVWVKIQNKG